MKTRTVAVAGMLAAMLSLPTQAQTLPDRPANLILAQGGETATCQRDGRRVPRGTTYCREGQVVRCNSRGSWERTDKRC